MDTLKKEIYIEARRLLENRDSVCLCIALRRATCNLLGYTAITPGVTLHEVLSELFPEFFAMYDGVHWGRTPVEVTSTDSVSPVDAEWWETPWPEPRLAMIDYLLSR